ncbi:LIM-domain binding protein-domain-containing protein [Scleroderma yunnanense]
MPPGSMNPNSHFLATQQQPRQQQPTPSHMSLMPNANNSLLGGGAQNNPNPLPMPPSRYPMPQQNSLQQGQNPQINPSTAAAAPPHLSSLGHNPLQGVGFMQQSPNGVQVRRSQSHPQGLNQSHVPTMIPPGQNVNGINMPMNPQAQLRQPSHMHRISSIPGSISPDIMGRQPNPTNVPQNQLRPAPQPQLMSSLAQPSGLQQSLSQNAFQQHPHHTPSLSSSPRLGVHPQQHLGAAMMMATQGASQPSGPRQLAHGENAFVGIPNPQFPASMVSAPGRIPTTNPVFSFGPPVTQSDSMDMPPSISDGLSSSANPQMRPGFQPTQAQFDQSHPHFNHQSQGNAPPPRPPSHPGGIQANSMPPRSMQPPSQHSPHQSDPMAGHVQQQPQRPQSQPQGPPGRPPSQAGPSHTPRSSQSQLPQPGLHPASRMQPQSQPQASPLQQRQSPSVQPHTIAPRPQQGSSSNPPGPSSEPGPSQQQQPMSRLQMVPPLGLGQGCMRLLQFSGQLSNESPNKHQLLFWESLVREYFTPKAIMKITLWKDNQKVEAKPLEIGVPILPRFFLVTTQSGVKSMTLSLDGARERLCTQSHAVIECVSAVWTYKYTNGYTVTLRGPLTVHVVIYPLPQTPTSSQQLPFSLKFEHFQFDANIHEKFIALESISGPRTVEPPRTPRPRNNPTPSPKGGPIQQRAEEDRQWDEPRTLISNASIPAEPVNAFGIPQVTMRCLELAEGVSQMTELIGFARENNMGPMGSYTGFGSTRTQVSNLSPSFLSGADALTEFAKNLREQRHPSFVPPVNGTGGFQGYGAPSVTLHPSMLTMNVVSSGSSPQNAVPSSADTPQKQSKPPTSGPAAPAANQPPAPSQAGLTPTSAASSSLKRKSDTSTSPTTTNAESQAKRSRKFQKRERNG